MTIRSSLWLTAISLAVFSPLGLAAQHSAPDRSENLESKDLADLLALEQRDIAASKINDVETLVSLWAEDGVLLMPGSEPVVGIPALRALLDTQKQKSANLTTLAYDEHWNVRKVLGDYAYEWGDIQAIIRQPDGKQAKQKVYALRILRRQQDGTWKVARAIVTPAPKEP